MGGDGDPARPTSWNGATVGPPPAPPRAITKELRLVAPPFDIASTSATIDAWPLLVPGIIAHAVTSFDRSGGNDDGFSGNYSDLYVDERGERVIFDERGPGVVRALWMTSRTNGDAPLGIGRLRFYFDDEIVPRFVADADDLFRGKAGPPFLPELVFDNQRSSGGYVSFAPLPFRRRLRITTEEKAAFLQVHFDRLPADWDVASGTSASADTALVQRFAGERSNATLEEVPLDTTKTGEGTIDVLRFEPAAPLSEAELRQARIKIWFDAATSPQVDAPLGAFFGSGLGLAPVRSILWTMTADAYESRLPMPYFENVHVKIEGAQGKLSLHVGPPSLPRGDVAYLETRVREEKPTNIGHDFFYASTRGTGKLVAQVLTVEPTAPSAKQWWEGDQKTTIDGAGTPSIHGTGHEDDFFGGWSNEFLSRPFSLPLNGCPKSEIIDTNGPQLNARATMYRVFTGVPFASELRHVTEHGLQNDRPANYSAVTFLYRQPRERLHFSDGFDVESGRNAYAATVDARETIASRFEGSGLSLTKAIDRYRPGTDVRFTFAIEPDNAGIVIRRLFDTTEAPAEAKLFVDDVLIRLIGGARQRSSERRWATEDTFVPPQVTRGKSSVVVVLSAAGAIGAARFEAFTLRR